jgi:hypothetical protein
MDLEHEKRLTEVEARSKSNAYRIEELEHRQDNLDELASSVKVLATKQETVETDVKEIKTDVKALTEKPGKRWESIVDKALVTIAAAVIGFVLARLGLG